MRSRLFVILFLIIAASAAYYWWSNQPTEVEIVHPYRGTAAEIVYATAVVEPENWAKVTPLIRERIIALCDCEGDQVSKGDELAVLDSGDARATLRELEARQLLAQSERERAFELLQRKVISQHLYDRAQSQLVQINALLAAQKERLNDYQILSPMDGVVLREDGSIGEVAEPGTVLFWIGQPLPLQLIAEVNEEDIPKVEPGQKAFIRADAFPDQTLEASVRRITPKGDPILKNYRVYLDLPADTPLRIGMTVELNVVTREVEEALLIPVAAMDGNQILLLSDDGTVQPATIKTGIRGTRAAEILDGLSIEDRVITPFRDDLETGQKALPALGVHP